MPGNSSQSLLTEGHVGVGQSLSFRPHSRPGLEDTASLQCLNGDDPAQPTLNERSFVLAAAVSAVRLSDSFCSFVEAVVLEPGRARGDDGGIADGDRHCSARCPSPCFFGRPSRLIPPSAGVAHPQQVQTNSPVEQWNSCERRDTPQSKHATIDSVEAKGRAVRCMVKSIVATPSRK
jgi:hypothetical protein